MRNDGLFDHLNSKFDPGIPRYGFNIKFKVSGDNEESREAIKRLGTKFYERATINVRMPLSEVPPLDPRVMGET